MFVRGGTDCFGSFDQAFQDGYKNSIIQILFPWLVQGGILELPSGVFSVCHNLYQKFGFCWKVYDRCTNCKFINWYPDVTIQMLVYCYSIFDWKEFELLSYRWVFLESTEISASEEPNASEKVPVQFMPLQKLSGKFHFLVQFYTSSWKHTYPMADIGRYNKVFQHLEMICMI